MPGFEEGRMAKRSFGKDDGGETRYCRSGDAVIMSGVLLCLI